MDCRRQELGDWLAETLGDGIAISVASADASFRRYFRVEVDGKTRIAMDAPPEQEDCRPFLDIARRLARAGLNAPEILAEDPERGFLLLSDLGNQTLLEAMSPDKAEAFMVAAIDALVTMQSMADPSGLPDYDRALLQRELDLYPDWYLKQHAATELDATDRKLWQHTCEELVESALSQPQVFVHRDYMLRNLMVSEPMPGVIDFQDAVRGPVSYDLVSLFRDAFITWPEDDIARWRERYAVAAESAGIGQPEDLERSMDLMGMQRHLKVIGIFARLHYRDGKERYLAETPRFHRYLYAIGGRYPEFEAFIDLLQRLEVKT